MNQSVDVPSHQKRRRAGALQNLAEARRASNCLPRRSSAVIVPSMAEPRMPWPHAPVHQLSERGTYFVTGSAYQKAHHFRGAKRLDVLQRGLLTLARDFG
jgi:hypothetical protein